uniref:Conserved oligomeric Golgi complex subunit 3 n=1 Tax=Cyprinus carpio TaxID=7962 RepID=A0A8C2JUQ4_CYPCA
MMASSTEQSLLELSDKETREKLSHWDRRGDPMAPLTEKQTDSVLEMRAAAEVTPLPAELPIEDICSLASRSLRSTFTATLPESTEEVLLQGFQMLELENERIQTAQQFFSWFSKLQVQMDQDEASKYRCTRDVLSGCQEQCDSILNDVNAALEHLDSLQKQYLFVSTKTGTLHEACEQLLKEQSELVDLAESIQEKLSYFNELENINTKLNSLTLSVNSEGFIPMLSKLDECIEYVSSHPSFKDYPVYLTKFKQCLSRAMLLIKSHTVSTLQNLTAQLTKRDPLGAPNADNAFTLYYVKFRAAAPKVRRLIEQVEQRSNKIPELLLFQVRSGCAFMVHVCQDEHQLYNEFFSKPSSKLDELLEKLCVSLYDVLRPLIIHVVHLETLSELCGILKNEMLEDHVQNNVVQLAAFDAVVKQMLEDVQERLVYRTHIYIQTDITGYKPAPGDLAYPDKLQMMEVIAPNKATALFCISEQHDCDSFNLNHSLINSDLLPPTGGFNFTFKDLFLLFKYFLNNSIQRFMFNTSRNYLCICNCRLKAFMSCIKQCVNTQIDGQLFLIKHLLIMREQIAPFHADFAIKEISLDLRKTRDAAFKILNPKAMSSFFRLNSHNAILEFLLEGTPEIKEHYIDSKKDVDRHLKSSCEQFIQQQTHMLVGNLEEFLTKVAALKTMAVEGGPTYNLSQQPWAQPGESRVSFSVLVNNNNTVFINHMLFQNNVQQVFQRLQALLQEEYSGEDLQIIACPSMEQINLLLSVK